MYHWRESSNSMLTPNQADSSITTHTKSSLTGRNESRGRNIIVAAVYKEMEAANTVELGWGEKPRNDNFSGWHIHPCPTTL